MTAADRHLRRVGEYVEELGGGYGEWDLGDFSERQRLAEKLRAKSRPVLIEELQEEPLDEEASHEFAGEWVEEVLGLGEL